MDVLENLGLDPRIVISGVMLSIVLVFILYRRFLVSIFDPLTLFMFAQIGDVSVLWAFPLLFTYKWQFMAYFLCLWAGFAIKGKAISTGPAIVFDQESLFDLKFILTILCLLIVASNLYLGLKAGFPLLSANPTGAKYTIYTDGLGFVRRINTGPYFLLCAGCSLLAVIGQNRRYALTIITVSTSLVMLGGAKSVLLPLLLTYSLATLHKGVSPGKEFNKSVRKYLFLFLGAGTAIALIVTTKDRGGLVAGIQGFLLRLLLFGDVILFYYPRHEIVMTLVDPSILGYLQNVSGDLLGLLRIGNYQTAALGSLILGSEDGGPNVQYFVIADLFFGPALGCLYCFLAGILIGTARNEFFRSQTKSAVKLSVQLFLAIVAFDFATEAGSFVTEIAVMFLFLLPLYVLARLCRYALSNPFSSSSPRVLENEGG